MNPTALYRWDLPTDPHTAPAGEHTAPADVDDQDRPADSVLVPQPLPSTLDDAGAPVLIHAMRGSMDAGHAGAMVAAHLLATHKSVRVATFDVDELLDYRSRRPIMTFETSKYTDYADPELVLDYLSTDDGEGMLLLHGVEPDLRWEAFCRSVEAMIDRLGVGVTVGVQGIPMGVPHTRPISVTPHGTRDGLVDVGSDVFGTVQLPGSASALLEYRLGESGKDAMGFAVHVPHYLAQSEYPAAAAELVRQVGRVASIGLDVARLEEAASVLAEEIDRQVAESSEVSAVVQALETQYDAFQEKAGQSLLAGQVPTAEELGAQFEAFLAQQGPEDGAEGKA